MSNELGLTPHDAKTFLNGLCKEFLDHGSDASVTFDANIKIGEGVHVNGTRKIIVGTHGVTNFADGKFVNDADFTDVVVALCHEQAHRLDEKNKYTHESIIFSCLSTLDNRPYYLDLRTNLPHEVAAEWSGVMTAWVVMESAFGSRGTDLMKDYICRKTEAYDKDGARYYFHAKDVPELTKNGVTEAFEAALDKSVNGPRPVTTDIRRYDTSVSKFFKSSEGIPYFRKLLYTDVGGLRDRMIASVNVYCDPSLMDSRLSSEDIDLNAAFDVPLRGKKMEEVIRLAGPRMVVPSPDRLEKPVPKFDIADLI